MQIVKSNIAHAKTKMHSISKEVLKDYQVRNKAKQKTRFIEWLKPALEKEGYNVTVEKSRDLVYSRNIVLGNPATAKYIFCAHYDTPAVLPFPNFITPKNLLVFLLYQIALTFAMLALPAAVWYAVLYFTRNVLVSQICLLGMLLLVVYFMMAGIPNKNNANDNTSGVITLIESAVTMPENLRDKAAFIFFDNEEKGMLGSSAYSSAHRKILKDKTVINFDCVSDGDEIYLFPNGRAKKDKAFVESLDNAFLPVEDKKVVVDRGFFLYPSDQVCFKKNVAVCAMKRSRLIGVYANRIHTARDTVFDENNIELLRLGVLKLIEQA